MNMNYNFLIKVRSFLNISLLFILLSGVFTSCGEDRTYEYEALTQHNIWMYEQFQKSYLWADKLPAQEWKDYFAYPQDYFAKLTSKGSADKWSYIIVDSIKTDPFMRGNFHHKNSYGFDFVVMVDPTQKTTRYYARVLTVYDDSPASRAGLKRNDFIETFDGYKLSQKNSTRLISGEAHKLVVRNIIVNEEDGIEWGKTRDVELDQSECVEDRAFPVHRVYTANNGQKCGYLMCTNLLETALSDKFQSNYKEELDVVMSSFKSSGLKDFILDLRLCNYGSIDMACRLATYMLSDDCLDKVFAKTIWNENNTANNKTIPFDSSLSGKTLGMNRVYVITSSYTRGAAEWLINALCYALGRENVIIYGESSAGQNVLTAHCGDYNDLIHIYPSVAYVADGDGNYESYASGFAPDVVLSEYSYSYLGDYGTFDEVILATILGLR